MVSLAFGWGCGLDAAGTGTPIDREVPDPGVQADAGDDQPTGMVRPQLDATIEIDRDARGPQGADATWLAAPDSGASDAAVPGSDASADSGSAPDAQVALPCEVPGTYAIRYDFDVRWPQTMWLDTYPVYAAGAGRFSLLARMTITSDAAGGTGTRATLAPCGVTLPDVAGADPAVLEERYGSIVPNAAWSAATMPSWTVAATASCAGPGCAFSLDPLAALLGAKLVGFDAYGAPLVELIDHDADGVPGLTTVSRGPTELTSSGKHYAYITLGTEARARKQRVVLAMFARLEGAFDSCSTLSGAAPDAAAGQTMVGCTGVVRGTTNEVTCDQSTASFFAATSPVWQLERASFRGVRIADTSCETVRTALR